MFHPGFHPSTDDHVNKIQGIGDLDSSTPGCLTRLEFLGFEYLDAPLRPNFWRPPTDNDYGPHTVAVATSGMDVMTCLYLMCF